MSEFEIMKEIKKLTKKGIRKEIAKDVVFNISQIIKNKENIDIAIRYALSLSYNINLK